MTELDGLIVKSTGGFYYVECGGSVYECRARGIFRKEGISPLVGDFVTIEADGQNGTVAKIHPRRNVLERPPLANIDRLVITASVCQPPPDLLGIDKLTAIAEHKGIEPVLVFTKADISPADEFVGLYRRAGFAAFEVSSKTGDGVSPLGELLSQGVSAFTGNSGVGKSSLLNRLVPGLGLEVGAVSRKLGRGRQTTRTVELFRFGGGYVADTPGFSSLDITRSQVILAPELQYAFRDFKPYIDKCRFNGCPHLRGEGCAVLDAVRSGGIAASRHANYCSMYDEVKDIKSWELKKSGQR